MKYIFYFFEVIILFVIVDSSFSQENQEESVVNYLKNNGLRVHDIAYCSSSYWISTQNGIVRYDGTLFTYFSFNESGPLSSFTINDKSKDTLFADIYNLYSSKDELWIVPQYIIGYESKLYTYKISSDYVYQYTINIDSNASYCNIDKLIFGKNDSPVLLIRGLHIKGTLDIKQYDVYELIGDKFCKKSFNKTSNEWISSYLFFNKREYTVYQEILGGDCILKLRIDDNKENDIILSEGNEKYINVNSFSYKDSTLLIIFPKNKKFAFFFMNDKSEFKIQEPIIDYRDECEGCLIGSKFYNLYIVGLIEYDISSESFNKYDMKENSDYDIFNGTKIKMIKNNLWCLFHKRFESNMNFNVFLYKYY
ncbi:MAG: hypothetical protein PHN88_02920 [Ignavibacteria bacterium]|nr:hypothetical protein [Ignavibacteria bacterium]